MWPDRVSNPGPLALESDALPIALRGPAVLGFYQVCLNDDPVMTYRMNHSIVAFVVVVVFPFS